MSAPLLLIARLLVASLFLQSGFAALSDIQGAAAYFASLGFPMPTATAWGVGLFELAAGLLLAIGLLTRPVALALAAFSLVASFTGHYGQGEGAMSFWHMQMFMKDFAVAGGLVAFGVFGAGKWSVDARRRLI